VYIWFSERQTPFHLSRCSSNSVNITTVQAVVEAVGCAGISQATLHAGDDRFWKWKCKTFESVNFPYLRDKHPGLDADEVFQAVKRNTMIPDLQEDLKASRRHGRTSQWWSAQRILTNTSKTESMRGYYRLQIFRGPSPSEFGFEGSRTPPPRPSDTPVIQIPIQSRPILKRTQRRNRMYAENVCRRLLP
jgi:hypothetical protein